MADNENPNQVVQFDPNDPAYVAMMKERRDREEHCDAVVVKLRADLGADRTTVIVERGNEFIVSVDREEDPDYSDRTKRLAIISGLTGILMELTKLAEREGYIDDLKVKFPPKETA